MNENKDEQVQQMLEMKEFQDSVVEKYDNAMGGFLSKKEVGGEQTSTDSFTFFVGQKVPESELAKDKILPKSITLPGGKVVATDVVEGLCMPMGYIDGLAYQDCDEKDATANATKQRPIMGGTSILPKHAKDKGEGAFGTLGCLVVDNEDGTLCALTNAHVACEDFFLPNFNGKTPRPADQLSAASIVNQDIFQGTESDGIAKLGDADSIGIVKRYSPIGALGKVDTSQVSTPYYKTFGRVNAVTGRPTIMCDAALIALKASVVSNDSWKQLGITSQGSSAPDFVTMAEYVQVMYDSAWGSFGTDTNSSPTTGPKMFASSRTSGPKEGDPEIEFLAPMTALTVPFRSSVSSAGYAMVTVTETFSFGLKKDSKPAKTLCHNSMLAGDSGSTIWVEINGTWKILGLAFASWTNPKTLDTKMGFAMPMPIVAQVMNISAWDGVKSTAKFLDTNDDFTVEQVVTPGLGKIDHYIIDNKKYVLGGTVLKSKSRASVFEPTYQMDHRDSASTTNRIHNDWLSQADDSVGYEGRLYFMSDNNTINSGYPVTQYTWTTRTGSYIISADWIAAVGSPYENKDVHSPTVMDQILATDGGYGISGCDAQGDIAHKAPECLNGDPITWDSRHPGIYDSSFKIGVDGSSYWSAGGALTIPSEFKSFYITLKKYNDYDPIKISYNEAAADGFDYTNVWNLTPYMAALARKDLHDGLLFRDAGVGAGNAIVPSAASLIFPIFKWEDINAAGLGGKAARYSQSNWDNSSWPNIEGWQMTTNSDMTQGKSHGINRDGGASHYASNVHEEPTFIPLFCLEPPKVGGVVFQGGTGYQEHGWIGDTSNNGDIHHSARSSAQGWIGNHMYGGAQGLTAPTIEGYNPSSVAGEMIADNAGSYWYPDNGYRASYYVLNPKWVDGMKQWRSRNGIPEDSSLSTPYGHEFAADSSIVGVGEDVYGDAKIDKQLEGISLLTEMLGNTEATGSWVTKFTT